MITLDSIPSAAPDIVSRQLDGEAVLVIPGKAQVKVINPTGAAIWSLLDGRRSVNEIALVLCDEFDVEPEQAKLDTLDFIADLAARGILLIT